MTTAVKKALPQNLIKASDLNEDSFSFSDLKVKDGRVNVYMHNARNIDEKDKDFNVLIVPLKTTYGLSDYQGGLSVTVKCQGITPNDQKEADNMWAFLKTLQEKTKEYFIENAKSILNAKDAKKLEKNPKLVQAWMNSIIKKDKNGEEQLTLKLKTNSTTKKLNIQNITVEKYKLENSGNDQKRVTDKKDRIDLSSCENQVDVLKEHIKPGCHVQAVIKPNIYWYGGKFGISWAIEALMILKSSSITVDQDAIDLNNDSIGFSDPKKNKDGIGYSALVLNKITNGLSGKIKTGALRLAYGISEYENSPGVMDQSIVLMNQTNVSEDEEANNKLFSFSEALNEAALDFSEEHKDIFFKAPDDDDELTRDLIESGYFNPCLTQNKNGDDQIKLKILKDENGVPKFTCYEYQDFNDETSKKEINWESMENPTTDIKNIIRGGSHIKAILQPRFYHLSNKVGVNYRLIELQVLKNNYSKQTFNDVFSFADDVQKQDTNDSEVTIEEEEVEEEEELEEEEEVDSDAYGSDESEDEIVEASA